MSQWIKIIRECHNSGGNVASWCRNNGIINETGVVSKTGTQTRKLYPFDILGGNNND
ncbi:hypothetical protein [Clostridium sp. OS1-26]|uniref:hypothetical protein n=1 Tax=Clostridium sp. OS1-26 TaxID=3070681 RepID=UPI0027E07A50|nr:hypothetical protein [Clostridium sp. OS1-26]WML33912.1 hypothetical protein RCG18_21695 [Clostridium sp. OS1-26]